MLPSRALRHHESELGQASIHAMRHLMAVSDHWRDAGAELDALLCQTHDDAEWHTLTDLIAETLFQQTRLATLIACLVTEASEASEASGAVACTDTDHHVEAGQKEGRGQQMKQRQKRSVSGTPQRITKAVTHIRLLEANPGKVAALNALAPVYLTLCQQYVTYFRTEEEPDKFRAPLFPPPLSERWHRVAIQQAERKVSRSFPPPAVRAGNASSGTSGKRSTVPSTSVLKSMKGVSLAMNSFRLPR
jgi:hypothetical protein